MTHDDHKTETAFISPAARDALQNWLQHQKALNGAAENTIIAYQGDVSDFLGFITHHKGDDYRLPKADAV